MIRKPITASQTILISSVITALVIIQSLFIGNAITGIIFGGAWLLWFGGLCGRCFLQKYSGAGRYLFGILILLSISIIINTLIYYLYAYTTTVFVVSTICISFGITLLSSVTKNPAVTDRETIGFRFNPKTALLTAFFLSLETMAFYVLFKSSTTEAIRSPWQVVPRDFFVIYFLSTSILLGLCLSKKISRHITLLVSLHFLLSLSVALIIYRLGYGFDSFIHKATEKLIAQDGLVTPKPWYYIGQYVLVVMLSKILSLSVTIIDMMLVPVLFSIYLPQTIYGMFKHLIKNYLPLTVASVSFLLFPFTSFIVTTPQGLANVFILITIFLSTLIILGKQTSWIVPLVLLGLATLAIHPLAGIPAVIFIIFTILFDIYHKKILPFPILQKFLIVELFCISSIAVPVIFIINSTVSDTFSSYLTLRHLTDGKAIYDAVSFLVPSVINNFDVIYDLVYWYENNVFLILVGLGILGGIILVSVHKLSSASLYLVSFVIFFLNYLIVKLMISFPALIDYERSEYPKRILEVSLYFLAPLILYGVLFLFVRSEKRTRLVKFSLLVFVSLGITSSLYISYPRIDNYTIDKGYNLTQSDINAVHYIAENAPGDYIVLANQMTSVAAIKEFGFKKYYPDKANNRLSHFYYPIPTSDPLYQYYLNMVYKKPKKTTARGAAELIGVEHVYFVLNSYWDSYDELVEYAKGEATSWRSIDEGKTHVFYYHAKTAL